MAGTPPLSELTWATTMPDDFKGKVKVRGMELERACREVGFKALGTMVTFEGRNTAEIKSRSSKAWCAFHKFASLLCNKNASIANRLKLLTILVYSSLFWCSGSWRLDNVHLSKLRGAQGKLLRRMLCFC